MDGGYFSDDLEDNNDDRRSRTESAGEKPGRENRCIPEGTSGEAVIKEGGDGVNSDSPRDGEKDKGKDEFPVGLFPVIKLDQEINGNKEVQ